MKSALAVVSVILYVLSIPVANWMIGHVGTCSSAGPCVVPVWPGVLAPSGVLVVGVALCLRDAVQRLAGRSAAVACVLLGAVVSFGIAPPVLALASAVAFGVSELTDGVTYGAVASRFGHGAAAVLLSGVVGLVLDSVLFLGLAFGSLDFAVGQIIGKGWAVLLVSVVVYGAERLPSSTSKSTI